MYAPNYDVPHDVSPFVPLPLLDLCTRCRGAMRPLESMNVVRDGACIRGLCPDCADELAPCPS